MTKFIKTLYRQVSRGSVRTYLIKEKIHLGKLENFYLFVNVLLSVYMTDLLNVTEFDEKRVCE